VVEIAMEDERSVRGVIRGAGACSALAGREESICSKICTILPLHGIGHFLFSHQAQVAKVATVACRLIREE
jgi:hypothetical protein